MGQAVAVDDIGLPDRVPKDVARHVRAEGGHLTPVTKRIGVGWLEGPEHKLFLGAVNYWHHQLAEWEKSSPDAIAAPLWQKLPVVIA
jgi:hypothetical protein